MAGLNARVDIYDPEKGDSKHDIPAGTKIEDLPDDWKCPRCKRKKEKFKVL
jgi:N-acyl homoserine lactone hydrolase